MTVTCEPALGMVWLPETFSLIVSTPSRISMRTVRSISLVPSTTIAIDSRYRCMRRSSPRLPVLVSSGLAASRRGPGAWPALMKSRTATSNRGFAEPPLTQEVKPGVEHDARMEQREQGVLFRRNIPGIGHVRLVCERQMRMTVDQTRNDGVPGDIDSARPARIACEPGFNRCDPVSPQEHISGESRAAGAVPDLAAVQ